MGCVDCCVDCGIIEMRWWRPGTGGPGRPPAPTASTKGVGQHDVDDQEFRRHRPSRSQPVTRVVMRCTITGTRSGPDGTRVDWPQAGEVLVCDDAEARDLIAGGLAFTERDAAEDLRRRQKEHAEWVRQRQQVRSWA